MNIYKSALQKYMGDYIVNQVNSSSEEFLKQHYKIKHLSILVIDIVPFKKIEKSLDSQKLFELTNSYYEKIFNVISKYNGFIETVSGVFITSLFGLEKNNYCEDSCFAALECIKEIDKLNNELGENNYIKIKMAINTGNLLIGNFGSNEKLIFSSIGFSKNFSARLIEMNEEYDTKILISEETKEGLTGNFKIKSIGETVIKGQIKTFKFFELIEFEF